MSTVALVVLDTLRKDFFDEYFDWLPGLRFERAYSTANWTAPAHASLFTGLYPSEAGTHAKSPSLDSSRPVLAELAREAGYRTRCWTANPVLSKQRQFDRGFEQFLDRTRLSGDDDATLVDWSSYPSGHAGDYSGWAKTALRCFAREYDTVASLRHGWRLARRNGESSASVPDDGARSILDRIRRTDFGEDEFLFVNLMETHTPYYPPPSFRRVEAEVSVTTEHALGLNEPHRGARQAYQGAVEYLAAIYERIFEELHAEFDYVVTLSDHGEMLGENGLWNHTHGLYPELTHVPLVLSGSDLGERTAATVSLLDVHRTVLDVLGIDGESRGRNLLDDREGRCSLAEYHGFVPIAAERLAERNATAELRRYDERLCALAAPVDYYGYETTDGYREQGSTTLDPRHTLTRLQRSIHERSVDPSHVDLSEATVDQLRDLGYV